MDLHRQIRATIKYAGFFKYTLSQEELHFWLISSKRVSMDRIKKITQPSLLLNTVRSKSLLQATNTKKTDEARKLVNLLRYVPGIKMIALTGSVAARNAKPKDDIDLMFITTPHTLWIIRPIVILIISLFFRRRYPGEDHSLAEDAFCPNLWLDLRCISVPKNKRNLYTAHEVLQVTPLLDRKNTYQNFLQQNRWVKKYLSNAYHYLCKKPLSRVVDAPYNKLLLILAPINYLFYCFQMVYMYPKKTSEHVNLHSAYLHTTDYHTKLYRHLENAGAL